MRCNMKIPQGHYQYLAAITASINLVTCGMHYGWTSPSLEKLKNEITNDEGSWMAVMSLLGALLGSVIVCVIVDVIGRKRTIILSSIPFFASWITIAYAKSVIVFYVARFIAGIAEGLVFTAVPMYLGEISDPNIRGMLGSGITAAWIFGALLINIIGSYLSVTVTALISSSLPIVTILTFSWMPESPYYLLMKNNQKKAKRSLQIFRGLHDVESELNRLSSAVKSQMANTGKILDLITVKSNRRAAMIIMILRGTQQFSGTTAITFFTQSIFKDASDTISPQLATIIYVSVQLIVCVFSSGIVDKTGRRPLLIISATGSALALFIEGTYLYMKTNTSVAVDSYSVIPVAALIAFVIIFSLGMQTIPLLMVGELFPTNIKAFALCFADIYFSLTATIASKFFQITKDYFGMFVPFYAFTLSCLVGLVLIYFFVPETKGKTLEEIQMHLKGETVIEKTNKNKTNENVLTTHISEDCKSNF